MLGTSGALSDSDHSAVPHDTSWCNMSGYLICTAASSERKLMVPPAFKGQTAFPSCHVLQVPRTRRRPGSSHQVNLWAAPWTILNLFSCSMEAVQLWGFINIFVVSIKSSLLQVSSSEVTVAASPVRATAGSGTRIVSWGPASFRRRVRSRYREQKRRACAFCLGRIHWYA